LWKSRTKIWKMGKLRKNWKERYFVLYKHDVLAYYSDLEMKNQKGSLKPSEIAGYTPLSQEVIQVDTPDRIWHFAFQHGGTGNSNSWAERSEAMRNFINNLVAAKKYLSAIKKGQKVFFHVENHPLPQLGELIIF